MEYTVNEQIQMYSHRFTATDLKIADFIQNHPDFLIDKGISEFAQEAAVSISGISRFCQKIGYNGFNAFKFSLLQEQGLEEPILQATKNVGTALCDDYITILRRSIVNLKQADLDCLLTKLQQASQVSVYGLGSSGLISQEFANKLKRIGFKASAYTDSHAMVIDAALVGQGQVVIAFSHSGQTRELNYAIEQAKRAGAFVCVVTNVQGSLATMIADLAFYTPVTTDLANTVFLSPQIAQFFLIDTLYKQLLERNDGEYLGVYQRTLQALKNRE